jgi:hypothetical protein
MAKVGETVCSGLRSVATKGLPVPEAQTWLGERGKEHDEMASRSHMEGHISFYDCVHMYEFIQQIFSEPLLCARYHAGPRVHVGE